MQNQEGGVYANHEYMLILSLLFLAGFCGNHFTLVRADLSLSYSDSL